MKNKVGNLTRIDEEYKITNSGQKRKFVNCICICGNNHCVDMNHWKNEKIKSCGCLKYRSLIGKSYGRLTVIEETDRRRVNSTGEKYWNCKCICGNTVEIATTDLTKKNGTRSCGCLQTKKDLDKVRRLRIFSRKKSDARRRKIEFELDEFELENLINRNCFYCNSTESNKMKISKREKDYYVKYMGIDRKDCSLGYTVENSIPCCFRCNTIKNRMTFKEYLEKIARKKKNG